MLPTAGSSSAALLSGLLRPSSAAYRRSASRSAATRLLEVVVGPDRPTVGGASTALVMCSPGMSTVHARELAPWRPSSFGGEFRWR
jgi:hypothetical protein